MDDLVAQHGSAKRPNRPVARQRVNGMSDETVAALGKLSEALEVVEAARGFLYQFHRMSGTADLTLQEACTALRDAGHDAIADQVDTALVGRDVIDDSWTFELVERYDAQYWSVFRDIERSVRDELGGGVRHVYEAEMKHQEQRED